MKKVLAILCFSLLLTGAMAQQLSDVPVTIKEFQENSFVQTPLLTNSDPHQYLRRDIGDDHSIWINFPFTLNDYTGGTWTTNTQIMFPDSFVLTRYTTIVPTPQPHYEFVYNRVPWHSVGLTLNPKSDYIGLPNLWNGQEYTVDSISLFFGYYRFTDASVVDTLVIQLYKPAHLSGYTWTSTGAPAFAIPGYSRTNKEGAMADLTLRRPLTIADTHTFKGGTWGIWTEALSNFKIDAGGPVGITWTFKSGRSYGYLDTIPYAKWDSVQGVNKPLNAFFWGAYYDQSEEQLNEYTNGNLVNFQQRYTDFSSNFPSRYLPGALWTKPLYPIALFKITYTEEEEPIGINDLTSEVGVKMYPNPVASGSDFNVKINLQDKKDVNIELFDMLGHKVATLANESYSAGEHIITYPYSKLNAGVYVCRVSADNTSSSFRITIR